MKMKAFTLESDVDDMVKNQFQLMNLQKRMDYNEKSSMSNYMKIALKGAAKTAQKSNFGQPDFTLDKYLCPVVIECKLNTKKHIALGKEIKQDEKSVRDYAVNGAIHYARNMIASGKYNEVVAIGVSANDINNVKISVYYVFSPSLEPKWMKSYQTLNFLQNDESFQAFYQDATITEGERQRIIIETRDEILGHAKRLNKLMNDFNIGVDQRVVYVSGMLLAMQDVTDAYGNFVRGLTPQDLQGIVTPQRRDSLLVMAHIREFLDHKQIDAAKKDIMISQFESAIVSDPTRDKPIEPKAYVSKICRDNTSITKQIFCFIYEYVYRAIDMTRGAVDIMAEMYSMFLKYALSDGASLGKVLTPPYITSLMAKLVEVDKDSRVLDLATGSAAFLVAAMDMMIADANRAYARNTKEAVDAIQKIKKSQFLGVEVDAKMYTLAASNMILRGDGSSCILHSDAFALEPKIIKSFSPNKFLLNPPFSFAYSGLPFFELGLDYMEKGGIGAVIIQDSVGAGKAVECAQRILRKHKMLASIKMPADLFNPNANVQTSIYVFEAGCPHNFEYDRVKFIDFRNDGFKRTKRCIKSVDSPFERYADIFLIYKCGMLAASKEQFHPHLWNLDVCYNEDFISPNGDDWNCERHLKYNLIPEQDDYLRQLTEVLKDNAASRMEACSAQILSEPEHQPHSYGFVRAGDIFSIASATPSYEQYKLQPVALGAPVYDYITRTTQRFGVHSQTSSEYERGRFPSGTFSLELMNITIYLRNRPWYAGQFVKVVSCRDQNVDDDAKRYLSTVLNACSPKLRSVLVRDVESVFNDLMLKLPLNAKGEVDYCWMSNYISGMRKKILSLFYTDEGIQ